MTTEQQKVYEKAFDAMRDGIDIHMDFHTIMSIIGQIQLAMRHPANTGPSTTVVRRFVNELRDKFKESGHKELAEIIDMGWHPEYDE